MSRKAEFNFTSEDHIGRKPNGGGVEYRVSLVRNVQKKDGEESVQWQLYFPKDVIWSHDLKGKRLKFYLDTEKKAIAWRVMEGSVTLDALNKGREVKPWSSGAWAVSITKLIGAAEIELEEGRSKIPVEKYITTELSVPMQYYYIKLK